MPRALTLSLLASSPREQMNELLDRFVNVVLKFKRLNCKELVPVSELNSVQSLCKLLRVLATAENGVDVNQDRDAFDHICKIWFMFW